MKCTQIKKGHLYKLNIKMIQHKSNIYLKRGNEGKEKEMYKIQLTLS